MPCGEPGCCRQRPTGTTGPGTTHSRPRTTIDLRLPITWGESSLLLPDLYRNQGLVFTTNTGGPINPSNLRQRNLRFTPEEGRSPPHPFSRPPAHLRHAAPL